MISPGTDSVRLTDGERTGILEAVEAVALQHGFQWDSIALFGSRTDPRRKGGDIDLYIHLSAPAAVSLFRVRSLLTREIQDRIGEQKVDVVLDNDSNDLGAFGEIIASEKREIWTK